MVLSFNLASLSNTSILSQLTLIILGCLFHPALVLHLYPDIYHQKSLYLETNGIKFMYLAWGMPKEKIFYELLLFFPNMFEHFRVIYALYKLTSEHTECRFSYWHISSSFWHSPSHQQLAPSSALLSLLTSLSSIHGCTACYLSVLQSLPNLL